MTVAELIEILQNFDPDTEVVIGMKQRYGSDFAMEIVNVTTENVDSWYGDECEVVVITEGSQLGVVEYENDYDDEDY